jgi:acyl-lipid omega-6 desaturase (Delta-12 desaturase)
VTAALQRRAAAFESRASAAGVAEAPAAPAQQFPSPVAGLSDEQRAELAQELGYRQIGKDLPSDVTLQRVISTLPKDVSFFFVNSEVFPSPCL